MTSESRQNALPEIHARWVWVITLILIILTRWINLGHSSPWLDEILNWAWASHTEFWPSWLGAHQAARWMQYFGISISDSVWGLRLPSAIFGSLTVVIAVAWSLKRFDAWAALCIAFFFALSPFQIFFSQDANYYAPISFATICWIACFDLAFSGERKQPVWLLGGLFSFIFAFFCHPLSILGGAGFFAAVFVWLLLMGPTYFLPNIPVRTKRLAALLIAFVVGAFAFYFVLGRFDRLISSPPARGRQFGLNYEFVTALFADFLGFHFRHTLFDHFVGVAGTFLALAGWFTIIRKKENYWLGTVVVLVFFAASTPFVFFSVRQYFTPRYLTPMQPILLLGLAFFIYNSILDFQNDRKKSPAIIAGSFTILFTLSAITWIGHRYRYPVQPSVEAIEWIQENTADNAIITTRHPYSGRSFDFLWDRHQMGSRTHQELNYDFRNGQPSIQQLLELSAGSRPVYYLSLLEDEDFGASDFRAWVEKNTNVAVHLESSIIDAFVPISWDVIIRKVSPPQTVRETAFALPRKGKRPTVMLSERALFGRELVAPAGAVLGYQIDVSDADSVVIEAEYELASEDQQYYFVARLLGDTRTFAWEVKPDASEKKALLQFPVPPQMNVEQLDISLVSTRGWRRHRPGQLPPDWFMINSLSSSGDGRTPDYRYEANDLGEWRRYNRKPFGLEEPVEDFILKANNPREPLLLISEIHPAGVGFRGVTVECETSDTKLLASAPGDWTFGPVSVFAVFRETNEVTARPSIQLGSERRTWNLHFNLRDPVLLSPHTDSTTDPNQD